MWINCRKLRELALRHKVIRDGERWNEHSKALPVLTTGQHVFIQNQRGAGKQAKRWDRTGVIVENSGNDKYAIRVDGSGRVLQRNRRFLRSFKPMIPQPTMPSTSVREPDKLFGGGGVNEDVYVEQSPIIDEQVIDKNNDPACETSILLPQGHMVTDPEPIVSQDTTQVRQQDNPQSSPSVRKSTRIRKPNTKYNAEDFELSSIHGKLKGRKNKYP